MCSNFRKYFPNANQDLLVVGIHQPNYIPWLGYFYKIFMSDIFVFHDDVQFSKKGMHNYSYIQTANGLFRLKIPVRESHGDLINEVITKDEFNWKKDHLKIIKENYCNAPHFEEVFIDYKDVINRQYDNLSQMNITIISFICQKLGISLNSRIASDFRLQTRKEEKVIDLVAALNGSVYFSGTGASSYQDENNFLARGIRLVYSDFVPFKYPQRFEPFNSNVSIIDYLMNCGYNWNLVMQNQNKRLIWK
ncbi:MAG: WbqC family protein [Bacteroidales bacterium]|nr:WbqC family protein [Bacteroidales bacterium]